MKKLIILPYKMGSKSSKGLSSLLSGRQVYPDRNYKPKQNHFILNWGCSNLPQWNDNRFTIFNSPVSVSKATNKLTTLRILKENSLPVVPFTESYDVAYDWSLDGHKVVCRSKLNGSRGEGIDLQDGSYSFEGYPLYTKFIANAREYRVHVFDGKIIDVQQKKRRQGSDVDGSIKNIENGWVFVRENITEYPQYMLESAVKAVQVLGLDFGGVDVLVKNGEVFILEINCAVGLENTTLLKYANEIKKCL